MTSLNVEVKLEYHNHRMNPFHLNRKNVKYKHMLERDGSLEDFQRAFHMVSEGKIPIEKLITHRITLDQLPMGVGSCAIIIWTNVSNLLYIPVWDRMWF